MPSRLMPLVHFISASFTSPNFVRTLFFARDKQISSCGKANSTDKTETTSLRPHRSSSGAKLLTTCARDRSVRKSVKNSRMRQSVSDNFASFATCLMLLARGSGTLAFFSSFSAASWSLLSAFRADFLSSSSSIQYSSCSISCSSPRAWIIKSSSLSQFAINSLCAPSGTSMRNNHRRTMGAAALRDSSTKGSRSVWAIEVRVFISVSSSFVFKAQELLSTLLCQFVSHARWKATTKRNRADNKPGAGDWRRGGNKLRCPRKAGPQTNPMRRPLPSLRPHSCSSACNKARAEVVG